MAYTARRVNFPYEQALDAAKEMWQLGHELATQIEPARQRAAQTAIRQWQGRFRDQFDHIMTDSASSATNVSRALAQAADNLAHAWASAQHQQQTYIYYAMVQHAKDSQSVLDSIGNWMFGDSTNYGSKPPPPAVPAPPDFAPTPVPGAAVPGQTPPPLA
jgi:uncharacterized protein YukE